MKLFPCLALSALTLSAAGCGFFPITKTSTAGAELLREAPKPAPVDSEFDGCGDSGAQPDYTLNRLKNRVDEGNYVDVPFAVLAKLPWPRQVGYRFRNQWTQRERDAVNLYEGSAVRVHGYLTGYRLEIPEPPNCYSTKARHKDYHMWLNETPGGKRRDAVVIELTPRVRVNHAGWTEDRLAALVELQVPVRVSGWLMLDQMHPENVRGNRVTLWEVHPIMNFEWQRPNGTWVSLDSAAPAR